MPSPKQKLTLALSLSLAAHSLLFIKGEPVIPQLSERSIIHARLDKQNRELIQQEQTGQIAKKENEQISEASKPSPEVQDQPTEQVVNNVTPNSKPDEVIHSSSNSDKKVFISQEEIKEEQNNESKESELEEIVETNEVLTAKPSSQQDNQISSDSRAQVEALEGSEDPTYMSYRRILSLYLSQRLEAHPNLKGRVRLKIKLEYGSIATSIQIIESSGDARVDQWAKKAALAANPYPKIPIEIGSTFEFSPTLQLGAPETQ